VGILVIVATVFAGLAAPRAAEARAADVGAADASAPAGRSAAAVTGTYAVEVSSAMFVDPSRPTPARVGVAAAATRTIHEVIYNPDGPVGPLPTVVFAPGFNNQSSTYDVLLRAIASAGYLVIGVDSPGSSSWFPGMPFDDPTGEDIGNNTLDLAAAVDNLEAGPLAGRVDRWHVAAVGHSDGGSAVADLALDDAYVSTRFNAYVVLTGGVAAGEVPGDFGPRNNGPLLVMIGTADELGNYDPRPGGQGTELVYDTAGSSRVLVTMAEATHFSAYLGATPQAVDTRAAIVAFLDVAERHDPGARAAFAADVGTDGLSAAEDLSAPWFLSPSVVGMASTFDGLGYWVALDDGSVRNLGDAAPFGGIQQLTAPISAIAATADGAGYWLVTTTGAVYSFGDATYHGGLSGPLNAPVVGMTADPVSGGYWLLAGDGGVFSFDAPFYGSAGGVPLNAPAVGIAATGDGGGYDVVASDGGVFTYGDAGFDGSMGGRPLNRPVVGLALDPVSGGYWLVAADGGIFAFDAPYEGSTGGLRLNEPVVGMSAYPAGPGYRIVAADGGIFDFDAPFEGAGL
jgi:hypothetical protein